jgi:hypothetical protein
VINSLAKPFKMPERLPDDEDVQISLIDDNHYRIQMGAQHMIVSEHNAAILLGSLSLFLNIRLRPRDGRALKFSKSKQMKVEFR